MKDIGSMICGCSPCPQGASKLRAGWATHESQRKMKELQRKCNWKHRKKKPGQGIEIDVQAAEVLVRKSHSHNY